MNDIPVQFVKKAAIIYNFVSYVYLICRKAYCSQSNFEYNFQFSAIVKI